MIQSIFKYWDIILATLDIGLVCTGLVFSMARRIK